MLSDGTQRRAFASTPERRNENINVNKYFIVLSGDQTNNPSILQSQFGPLRHDKRKIDFLIELIMSKRLFSKYKFS